MTYRENPQKTISENSLQEMLRPLPPEDDDVALSLHYASVSEVVSALVYRVRELREENREMKGKRSTAMLTFARGITRGRSDTLAEVRQLVNSGLSYEEAYHRLVNELIMKQRSALLDY